MKLFFYLQLLICTLLLKVNHNSSHTALNTTLPPSHCRLSLQRRPNCGVLKLWVKIAVLVVATSTRKVPFSVRARPHPIRSFCLWRVQYRGQCHDKTVYQMCWNRVKVWLSRVKWRRQRGRRNVPNNASTAAESLKTCLLLSPPHFPCIMF